MNATPLITKWYHYIMAFFAGAFFINILPHFLSGIMGHPFPTPFANPPGEGMSSPMVNVAWGTVNFVIFYCLYVLGKLGKRSHWLQVPLCIGGGWMAFFLAAHFGEVFAKL